jgi:hypothetical protein
MHGYSRGVGRRDRLRHRPFCWPHGWNFRRHCLRRQGRDEGRSHDRRQQLQRCCHLERVRRSLHKYDWDWPVARLEYGYDRGPRCDLWLRCRGSWRGRLSDPVVNSHEVSVFCKLGDDFSCTHHLSLACDRCDRHEALLRGSVYPTLDLVESLCEVADGEVVSKTPASFVPLSITLTSSVPVGVGLIRGCLGR